ncbi:hypothetical protein ACFV8Z_51795, partial [Streptomyces sp. NPDC059837]
MSEPQGSENTTRRMPVLEKTAAGAPAEDELDRSASTADHDRSRGVEYEHRVGGGLWWGGAVTAGVC